MGDIEPGSSSTPVTPSSLGKVTSLSAGELSVCAVGVDKKLYCWGTIYVSGTAPIPEGPMPIADAMPFDTVSDVARVAVGHYFQCMLSSAGKLTCLGLNDHGQLGVGSTETKWLPTEVTGFDGPVTTVSASMGGLFACATTTVGSVYCWGQDPNGLITGHAGDVLSPTRIEGLPGPAAEVASGGAHACARLVDGRVECWGEGSDGQLGNKKFDSSAQPVESPVLSTIVAIAAGRAHTCAVHSEGSVWCWGKTDKGQAGDGLDPSFPQLVREAGFEATTVSCGLEHSCASSDGAHVSCWGSNASSQLGPKDVTF
jgi:alpha-tubulin suppressor-like RCC1 family protein